MMKLTGKLTPVGVLTGKLSYTSLEIRGSTETPLVLRSAVMPMLDPTPSDQKIIDHAESEEI